MRKSLFMTILVLLLGVTVLAGCGTKESPKTEGTGATKDVALKKIVITQPVQDAFWSPVYLAQTLGYFKEAGLDAEFQTINSGDPGAPVFAGEAQFGLRGVEMPMTASLKGQGCKILVSTISKYPYTFVGYNQDYATIASLRGKIVAGTTPSGSPTAWVKACLAYGGLDYEKDVKMTMIPGTGSLAALANGDIQATYGGNKWLRNQMEKNGAVEIIDGTDPEVFNRIMGSKTYEMHILFASDEYIAKNSETVQKVVTSVAKALDFAQKHSAAEISQALYPLFPGREEEVLTCITDMKEKDMFNATGKHTASGYAAALKMAKLAGLIEKDIDASLIYDESFLDKAWAELGK